jgi:hypothetical protein
MTYYLVAVRTYIKKTKSQQRPRGRQNDSAAALSPARRLSPDTPSQRWRNSTFAVEVFRTSFIFPETQKKSFSSSSDIATAYQKHGWGIIKAKNAEQSKTKIRQEKKQLSNLLFVGQNPDQPDRESDSVKEHCRCSRSEAPKQGFPRMSFFHRFPAMAQRHCRCRGCPASVRCVVWPRARAFPRMKGQMVDPGSGYYRLFFVRFFEC